jgi:hypothetical protein
MNNLGRILLLVGGLVLALLVGVLIGRGQRAEPTSEGNAQAVQITTAPPTAAAPLTPLPAPAPTPAPQAAAVPKAVAPDLQVQEDAAAVGMTTRDGEEAGSSDDAAQPRTAGGADPDAARSQPIG